MGIKSEIRTYRRFLNDGSKYASLKKFWENTFEGLVQDEQQPYVDNCYSTGEEIQDGNPIYNTLTTNNKAIRLIQIEPSQDEPILAAWLDTRDIRDKSISELVISLQLTYETYCITKELVSLFHSDKLPDKVLDLYNMYFDNAWNVYRGQLIIQSLSKSNVFEYLPIKDIWRDVKVHSIFQTLNTYIHHNQQFDCSNEKRDLPVSSKSQISYICKDIFKSRNNQPYKRLWKSINQLNNVLTLNDTIIAGKKVSAHSYMKMIDQKYSSKKEYVSSLTAATIKLSENWEEIKDEVHLEIQR